MILPQFSCTARFEHFYRKIRGGDEFQDVPLNFSKTRLRKNNKATLWNSPYPRIFLQKCPNFAELESSKETKSYYENPCN